MRAEEHADDARCIAAVIWEAAYRDTLARLDADVASARLTLCGLSSCVDATVSLHDAGALFAPGRARRSSGSHRRS